MASRVASTSGRDRESGVRGRLMLVSDRGQSSAMEGHQLWLGVIADYRAWMTAASMSPHTIYLRVYQLRRLAEAFPLGPWIITTEQLVVWFAAQAWAAGTVRSWRSMLGSFYKWAVITGRTSHSPAALMPRPPAVRLHARPAPQIVVEEALASADPRLRVMIMLGRRNGLRRGEIAQVHTDDLVEESDGWWLLVHGKGGKERIVPVDDDVVTVLRRWLDGRIGWVFPGEIDGHLAAATVGRYVSRHLTGKWTTHTLRHRYATEVWNGSHDLLSTQKLLGHAKPETTEIYIEADRTSLRAAARWADPHAA